MPKRERPNPQALAELTAKIRELEGMGTVELIEQFEEAYGFPTKCRSQVNLRRRVAWKYQEQAEGGLSQRALDRIEELAPLAPARWRGRPEPREPQRDPRLPPPGTTITREQGGVEHQVEVLDDGFLHQGETFGSLSKVARAISGTRWNGFLFFKLNEPWRAS